MLIKVCGMRVAQNIRDVSALGVDWLGLVFCPNSPRLVTQIHSRGGLIPDYNSLEGETPKLGVSHLLMPRHNHPLRVGVFMDDMPQNIVTRVYNFNLDIVQLHGEESPVMIDNLRHTLDPDIRPGFKIAKTIFIESAEDFKQCAAYEDVVDYFVFHNKCAEAGGSGKKFDWSLLSQYEGKTPFLLSGGIGPEDAEAIKSIQHPMMVGVDINSKFEIEPGLKDVEKIRDFVERLRA